MNSANDEHFWKTETENKFQKLLCESQVQLFPLNVDPRSTTYVEATLLLAPYQVLLGVLVSVDRRKWILNG